MAERDGATKDLHVYLPRELYEWLQATAKDQRRSVNSQIVVVLEQARASRPA